MLARFFGEEAIVARKFCLCWRLQWHWGKDRFGLASAQNAMRYRHAEAINIQEHIEQNSVERASRLSQDIWLPITDAALVLVWILVCLEEEAMLARFGEQYQACCAHVRRWL